MKAMAAKQQPSNDFHRQHQEVIPTPLIQNEFPSTDAIVLQRMSACPCDGGCPSCVGDMVIQPKLKIGEPGDRYEREADRVADEVMRMPEPGVQRQAEPEVNKEKEFSPNKNHNSIHYIQNEHDKQPSSLTSVVGNISHEGGMPTGGRTPALLELQQTHANRYVLQVASGIQAKLRIGQPGDKYEQEADRIADTIMSMHEPQIQQQWEGKRLVARTNAEPIIDQNGKRLPDPCRRFFEDRLGYSFDNVRIHADYKAHLLSESLAARAFTYGTNIVFNRGEFNPANKEGQRIIAHELVHVIQQNSVQPETADSKPHPIHMQQSPQNLIQRIIPIRTVSPPECGSMSDARELLIQAHQVLESEEIDSDQYEALLSSISELETALENFEGTCRSSERPSSIVAPGGSVGMSTVMADRTGALASIVAIVGFLAAIVTGSQLSSLDPEQQERLRRQAEALQRARDRVQAAIRNWRPQITETTETTDIYDEPRIEESTPEEIVEDIIPEDEPPDTMEECIWDANNTIDPGVRAWKFAECYQFEYANGNPTTASDDTGSEYTHSNPATYREFIDNSWAARILSQEVSITPDRSSHAEKQLTPIILNYPSPIHIGVAHTDICPSCRRFLNAVSNHFEKTLIVTYRGVPWTNTITFPRTQPQ